MKVFPVIFIAGVEQRNSDALRAALACLQSIARRRAGRTLPVAIAGPGSADQEAAFLKGAEAIVLLLAEASQTGSEPLTRLLPEQSRQVPLLPVFVGEGRDECTTAAPNTLSSLLPPRWLRYRDVSVEHGGLVSLSAEAQAALEDAFDALLCAAVKAKQTKSRHPEPLCGSGCRR